MRLPPDKIRNDESNQAEESYDKDTEARDKTNKTVENGEKKCEGKVFTSKTNDKVLEKATTNLQRSTQETLRLGESNLIVQEREREQITGERLDNTEYNRARYQFPHDMIDTHIFK